MSSAVSALTGARVTSTVGGVRRLSSLELALLLAVAIWAVNLPATREVVGNGMGPLVFVALRNVLAALAFAAIVLSMSGRFSLRGRDLGLAGLAGLLLAANQVTFVYSLQHATASVVAFVMASSPLFAAAAGFALGWDRVRMRFWVGAPLSMAGVGVVALAAGKAGGSALGVLLAVATALMWTAYSLLIARLVPRHSTATVSLVVLAVPAAVLLAAASGQLARQSWDVAATDWGLLVFTALGGLVVTNFLWYRSIDRIGPARATLVTNNLLPFATVLVAVAVFGERFVPLTLVGGALILGGIVVVRGRGSSARTRSVMETAPP